MTDGYQRAQRAYDAAEPDDSETAGCPRCGGSGAEPWHGDGGEVWLECRRCEGEGEVRR